MDAVGRRTQYVLREIALKLVMSIVKGNDLSCARY
jgi:hypothetical protein